jgi:hypothetical protein
MEAGVSKTLWSISDIVALADNSKYVRRDDQPFAAMEAGLN